VQLQLETTNRCQARCLFCTHPTMTRPQGVMDWDLYLKILDDAVQIPLIDQVTLTGLGETLLDPLLLKRVQAVRSRWAAIHLDLYTNGSLLTEALIDDLLAERLTVLYVSLNAVRPEQREAIMGLKDYDRVVDRIRYAGRRAAELGGKTRVVVLAISDKGLMEIDDPNQFLELWGGPSNQGGAAYLHLEGNWAGHLWPMRIPPTQSCARALTQIMVLWDGRVALCCQDGHGEEILGDLKTQSLREIYNGGRALEVRTAHAEGRRRDIALCANCAGI